MRWALPTDWRGRGVGKQQDSAVWTWYGGSRSFGEQWRCRRNAGRDNAEVWHEMKGAEEEQLGGRKSRTGKCKEQYQVCNLSIYLSLNAAHFLQATFSSSCCSGTGQDRTVAEGLSAGRAAGREEVKTAPQKASAICIRSDPEPFHPWEDFLSSGNVNKKQSPRGRLEGFSRKERCRCEYSYLLADTFKSIC